VRWIIVLGMHRSGTSAFTQAVGSLGASMGNPAGLKKHLENVSLRRVNERLLQSGGGKWDAPPAVGWLDGEPDAKLVEVGRRVAGEEFPDGDFAVWKDPRTCLTVPFWLHVLPSDPVFLLIHRHPTEVAASLTERNSMGKGHGYALWERYNADALNAIAGRPTVVLDYPSVLTDPVGQLEVVASALTSFGIDLPNDPATAEHGLVSQRRHHTADDAEELDEIATESQRAVFATLNALHGAYDALPLAAPLPAPHPLSTEIFDMVLKLRKAKQGAQAAAAATDAAEEDPPDSGPGEAAVQTRSPQAVARRQQRRARKAAARDAASA
jgi:hypothetical protein